MDRSSIRGHRVVLHARSTDRAASLGEFASRSEGVLVGDLQSGAGNSGTRSSGSPTASRWSAASPPSAWTSSTAIPAEAGPLPSFGDSSGLFARCPIRRCCS